MTKLSSKIIIAPLATGNGAYIIHRYLAGHLRNYQLLGYNPYLTILPIMLPKIVSSIDASLIHTSPDYAIFFLKRDAPLIITFHNYVLDSGMHPYSSFLQKIHYKTDLRLYTYLAVKTAKKLTAVSHYTAALVKQHMGLFEPISVIYNGIDSDRFYPQKSIIKRRKTINVLFSGNTSMRKGFHWLPSIAQKLPDNIQIYYTQGLHHHRKATQCEKLRSLGAVPFENMPDLYREMDILLMPTVREGFGLAVAEAMGCGLPVVATNCSSMPELIDDRKGGYLCPLGDENVFAEKIRILADSPEKRRQMGEYNRAKVEKMFTLERMLREYKRLFEENMEN